MTLLLIDGDIIAYKAAMSAETPVNWGDGHWTLHCFEDDVAVRISDQITKLTDEAPVQDCIVALSDSDNYRKKVAPYYKANRKKTRKPMLLPYAREYIMGKYNTIIYKGLEADDVLGILGTANADTIIWSEDKDLLTVPAKHWLNGEVVTITEEEANYNFAYQTLVGDSTDNYSGCPTIGPKTANKLLSNGCGWDKVVDAFKAKGLSEEVALENARLARILRNGEYDTDTGEVKLWHPSNDTKLT
jgi:DNA polymerase-1